VEVSDNFVIDFEVNPKLARRPGSEFESFQNMNPTQTPNKITQDFEELFTGQNPASESFSDVTLVCEDQQFKVHKLILAARSEYFRRMFAAGYAESNSKEIKVYDVQPAVMRAVLKFLYTGEVDLRLADAALGFETVGKRVRTLPFALAVLEAANQFLLEDLKAKCEHNIGNLLLSFVEQIEVLIVAERANAQLLREFCLSQLKALRRLPLALDEFITEKLLPDDIAQLIYETAQIPPLHTQDGRLLVELMRKPIDLRIVEKSLNEGANPNKIYGLHHAVVSGQLEVIKLMLNHSKSEINTADYKMDSPLNIAVRSLNHEIISLLVNAGANIEQEDKNGRKPLHNYLKSYNFHRAMEMAIFYEEHIKIVDLLTTSHLQGESSNSSESSESSASLSLSTTPGNNPSAPLIVTPSTSSAGSSRAASNSLNDLDLQDVDPRAKKLDIEINSQALEKATYPLSFKFDMNRDVNMEFFKTLSTLAYPELSTILERSHLATKPNLTNRKRALIDDMILPNRKRQEVEHFPVLTDLPNQEDDQAEWGTEFI